MRLSTEIDRETQKQIVECYKDLGLAYQFELDIIGNFVESIDEEEVENEMSISLENDEIVDDSSEIEEIGTRLSEHHKRYQRWFISSKNQNAFKPKFVFDLKNNSFQ